MADQTISVELTDFGQAMQSVSLAYQLMQHVEWEELLAMMTDRDGTLCFRDPTLFRQVQVDPQWDAKCVLVKAAADFTRAVRTVKTDLVETDHG